MASAPAAPILLASTSPRRREILAQLRIPFDVIAPHYEETEEDPVAHALGKVRSVLGEADGRPVLGCDTEVVYESRVYGKPGGPKEAEEMLESLSGRTHEVIAGLALITPAWEELHREVTRVTSRRTSSHAGVSSARPETTSCVRPARVSSISSASSGPAGLP